MRTKWGWYAVVILSLVPIVFWSFEVAILEQFSTVETSLHSLGSLAGLVGMCFFAFNFIIAARYKFIESAFGGLNQVFIAHHVFGSIAFILLSLHPLFLAAQYLPTSIVLAAENLFNFQRLSMNYGRLAYIFLVGMLLITFYWPLKYQRWKLTHQFLGLALFFGGLHAFFIPSHIASNMPLRVYILSLTLWAMVSFTYRVILGGWLFKRYKYQVSSIVKETKNIMEISMTALKKPLSHLPGQFVFLSFQQQGISREHHPFSITSSPDSGTLSVGVKALGDYTETLKNLEPGTKVKVEGPYGRFLFTEHFDKDQIWIAGGIGITPFVSMARSIANHKVNGMTLIYSVERKTDAAYLKELQRISREFPIFSLVLHVSSEQGHLTADKIEEYANNLKDKEVFICGPKGMMKALKNQLTQKGVDRESIHTEEFSL